MRILVKGGAGYIGPHTCIEILKVGNDLVVVEKIIKSKAEALRRVEALAERRLFARFPALQQLQRAWIYAARELLVAALRHPRLMRHTLQPVAERFLERSVPDPELRAQLTPRYAVGCKRIIASNDYLPALQAPNVELITERVVAVTPRGPVTDGVEHPARPYDTTQVPAGTFHRFVNTGESTMRILWVYGSTEVTRTFADTGETVGQFDE